MTELKPFTRVLCRMEVGATWYPDIFLYRNKEETLSYVCTRCDWKYCIPYKGNEKMAFTSLDETPELLLGDKVRVKNSGDTGWKNAIYLSGPDEYGGYEVYTIGGSQAEQFEFCEHYNWE